MTKPVTFYFFQFLKPMSPNSQVAITLITKKFEKRKQNDIKFSSVFYNFFMFNFFILLFQTAVSMSNRLWLAMIFILQEMLLSLHTTVWTIIQWQYSTGKYKSQKLQKTNQIYKTGSISRKSADCISKESEPSPTHLKNAVASYQHNTSSSKY